jgi:hypothetical protein
MTFRLYPCAFIESLFLNYPEASLHPDIQHKLTSIKQSNIVSAPRQFVKTPYKVAVAAAIAASSSTSILASSAPQNDKEKLEETIFGSLNKLTVKNRDTVQRDIKQCFLLQSQTALSTAYDLLVGIVTQKAINENVFTDLYIELLFNIIFELELDMSRAIEYYASSIRILLNDLSHPATDDKGYTQLWRSAFLTRIIPALYTQGAVNFQQTVDIAAGLTRFIMHLFDLALASETFSREHVDRMVGIMQPFVIKMSPHWKKLQFSDIVSMIHALQSHAFVRTRVRVQIFCSDMLEELEK